MVGCLVAQPEDELLAARDDLVPAGGGGNAHHAVVHRGGGSSLPGVLEVEVAVGGEVGVEGERLQAALTARVDLGGDVEERSEGAVGFRYAYPARLLGHEHPAIGGQLHVCGVSQAACDLRVGEARIRWEWSAVGRP